MKKREQEPPIQEEGASDAPGGSVVTLTPLPPEALGAVAPREPDSLAVGIDVARRIEESVERARRARAHAKRARKSAARKATRRQLERLVDALQARQEQVLSQGILPEDHHTLAAHLHATDRALEEFMARRPRKATLKQVRKAAKTLRRSL